MSRARPRGGLLVGVLAALALCASGCAELQDRAPSSQPPSTVRQQPKQASHTNAPATHSKPVVEHSSAGGAMAQLASLRVAGRAPMTGYDRDRFGQAWLDADRNGCDTRNDMLRRDLESVVLKPNTQDCVVLSGVLADPYTGRRIDFVRGESYSVDIDHVVALGNAWVSGAWRSDIKTRAAFANDPLNLLAVDAGANRSKGDANAASWLPPSKAYRCAYVARQIAVKAKYHLAVTPPEKAEMARQLGTCPAQPQIPDATHAPTRVDQNIVDPGVPQPTSAPESVPADDQPGSGGAGSVWFENCDAARAAGAAPLRRGDPGYDAHLDRDGDGSACE